jgi:alpha-beta hydrolase superfamily lysophospholipase
MARRPGRHLHLGKGIEAVDAAWRHHGPFDAFVGHSFGGAVALNAALGSAMCVPARRPDALVMIAAPNSLPAIFRWFGRRIGLAAGGAGSDGAQGVDAFSVSRSI